MDFLQRFLEAIAQAIEGLMDACRDALNFIVRLFQTLLGGIRRILVQCAKLIFYAGPFAGLLFAGLDLKSSLLFWAGVFTLALPFVAAIANFFASSIAAWKRTPRPQTPPRQLGNDQTLFNVTLMLNFLTVLFFADWYFQTGYAITLWNTLLKAIPR